MLLLTAKPDDVIYVGDDIRLTITYCEGRRVRIGFDLPKDVQVWRDKIAPMEIKLKWSDKK